MEAAASSQLSPASNRFRCDYVYLRTQHDRLPFVCEMQTTETDPKPNELSDDRPAALAESNLGSGGQRRTRGRIEISTQFWC